MVVCDGDAAVGVNDAVRAVGPGADHDAGELVGRALLDDREHDVVVLAWGGDPVRPRLLVGGVAHKIGVGLFGFIHGQVPFQVLDRILQVVADVQARGQHREEVPAQGPFVQPADMVVGGYDLGCRGGE